MQDSAILVVSVRPTDWFIFKKGVSKRRDDWVDGYLNRERRTKGSFDEAFK